MLHWIKWNEEDLGGELWVKYLKATWNRIHASTYWINGERPTIAMTVYFQAMNLSRLEQRGEFATEQEKDKLLPVQVISLCCG